MPGSECRTRGVSPLWGVLLRPFNQKSRWECQLSVPSRVWAAHTGKAELELFFLLVFIQSGLRALVVDVAVSD